VEDLIQESMSRGEFDNLAGTGKPLKHQASNPYVDFVTHKMNQVTIVSFSLRLGRILCSCAY
jgi:DnaJ family protein C protein 28